MSMPNPALLSSVPMISRPQTTAAEKISPTTGLRRTGWTLAKASGTTSSRAMP